MFPVEWVLFVLLGLALDAVVGLRDRDNGRIQAEAT